MAAPAESPRPRVKLYAVVSNDSGRRIITTHLKQALLEPIADKLNAHIVDEKGVVVYPSHDEAPDIHTMEPTA